MRGLASAWRGWRGVARSVRIYHLDRAHIAGLTELLRPLARPSGLAFDIGAHVGDRTRVLRALGLRVVAVEPQPRLARVLRLLFRRDRKVTVVEAAVGAHSGHLDLLINTANPTVSTGSGALVAAAAGAATWEGQHWDDSVRVRLYTFDDLIARYGVPDFAKIDVEGLEDQVLAGLSRQIPVLSFEFTTVQRDVGLAAVRRAAALGYTRFNLTLGESHQFRYPSAIDADELQAAIAALPDEANSGDVYAFAAKGRG